jgi:hypothetical protein
VRYKFVKEKGRVSVEGVKSLWDDRLSHRGLKLDGAIGQGEICNSIKSENFHYKQK